MTTKDVLKQLCHAFMLTLNPYDQYNSNPIEFMHLLENTLYGVEIDTEELDWHTARAFELFIGCVGDELKEGAE